MLYCVRFLKLSSAILSMNIDSTKYQFYSNIKQREFREVDYERYTTNVCLIKYMQ